MKLRRSVLNISLFSPDVRRAGVEVQHGLEPGLAVILHHFFHFLLLALIHVERALARHEVLYGVSQVFDALAGENADAVRLLAALFVAILAILGLQALALVHQRRIELLRRAAERLLVEVHGHGLEFGLGVALGDADHDGRGALALGIFLHHLDEVIDGKVGDGRRAADAAAVGAVAAGAGFGQRLLVDGLGHRRHARQHGAGGAGGQKGFPDRCKHLVHSLPNQVHRRPGKHEGHCVAHRRAAASSAEVWGGDDMAARRRPAVARWRRPFIAAPSVAARSTTVHGDWPVASGGSPSPPVLQQHIIIA
jgi:hypothetical protein